MNAGKSTTLLQSAHNYRERGMNTLILAPELDNRYGTGRVTSRIGLEAEAITFRTADALFEIVMTAAGINPTNETLQAAIDAALPFVPDGRPPAP